MKTLSINIQQIGGLSLLFAMAAVFFVNKPIIKVGNEVVTTTPVPIQATNFNPSEDPAIHISELLTKIASLQVLTEKIIETMIGRIEHLSAGDITEETIKETLTILQAINEKYIQKERPLKGSHFRIFEKLFITLSLGAYAPKIEEQVTRTLEMIESLTLASSAIELKQIQQQQNQADGFRISDN